MAKTKTLKKEWYPILAPKIFRNSVLGETLVYEPSQIMGKGITQNLMNLTNDVKRQNINIEFEVVKVEDNKGHTDITGYRMVKSSVRRFIRRNIEKIDMSLTCTTSDKKNIRIKPLLITIMSTSGSVTTKLRENATSYLKKHISEMTYDNLTNDLISHKLQESLKANLKKIYPLRICEIRSMKIIKEQSPETVKSKNKEADTIKREAKKEDPKES